MRRCSLHGEGHVPDVLLLYSYHPAPNVTDTRYNTEEWMKAFSSVFVTCPEMRYGTR